MDALHTLLEGAGIGRIIGGSRGRRVSIELPSGPKTAQHKEHFGLSDEMVKGGAKCFIPEGECMRERGTPLTLDYDGFVKCDNISDQKCEQYKDRQAMYGGYERTSASPPKRKNLKTIHKNAR